MVGNPVQDKQTKMEKSMKSDIAKSYHRVQIILGISTGAGVHVMFQKLAVAGATGPGRLSARTGDTRLIKVGTYIMTSKS
jgi:hypothetical protein